MPTHSAIMHAESVTSITDCQVIAGQVPVGNRLITQHEGTCVSRLTLRGHPIGIGGARRTLGRNDARRVPTERRGGVREA